MGRFIFKDGKKYLFASKKLQDLNTLFGITPEIRKEVDAKLESQRNFLKDTFIEINEEKYISLFDMSNSANIQPNKYYGEMFNRVDTLRKFATEQGFTSPVFMTLTPPSYLKPLKQVNLKRNRVKLVDNPRFGGDVDYVSRAREYMSLKWTKFLNQRIMRDMKKEFGERLIYMRTYEPFLDGTPHVHIVAFVPPSYLERFVNLAKNYFSDTRFDIKTKFDDDIGGVVAYVLKYILKSFSNSKTNQLDDVGYWYAYHQIRRFTTSRTLIPLRFYRLMKSKDDFKNLLDMTKLYKLDGVQVEVSYDSWKLHGDNFEKIKSTDYKVSQINVLVNDGFDFNFQVVYKKSANISIYKVDRNNPTRKPQRIIVNKGVKKPDLSIKLMYDDKTFVLVDDVFRELFIPISRMRDHELFKHYSSLDLDTCNLHHFGLIQNECIGRGLIKGYLHPINDFSSNIIERPVNNFDAQMQKARYYHNNEIRKIVFTPTRSFLNSLELIKNLKIGV